MQANSWDMVIACVLSSGSACTVKRLDVPLWLFLSHAVKKKSGRVGVLREPVVLYRAVVVVWTIMLCRELPLRYLWFPVPSSARKVNSSVSMSN